MSTQVTGNELERDLAAAIDVARRTADRVHGLRGLERWEGRTLADVGDQAGDGYLQGFFLGRYPEDGILSEETADSPDRLAKDRVWILDPLDGTKEYSQLRVDWAIHVALTFGGACGLAAVALPSDEDVLWGVALPGRERAGSTKGRTLLRGDSEPPSKLRLVVSRSHTPPWVEKVAEILDAELVPCGSAGYKVSRLLLGEADIYVHKVGLKEWDTCAPETIARALGWHVSKLAGDEHTYNRPDPKNHELLICRPAMRERVLEAVAKSGALES